MALLSNVIGEDVLAAKEKDEEYVILSTIHQAKGLEWKTVFVIWLADGMFPDARNLKDQALEEEERRLFYVAITRAKDTLHLYCPIMNNPGRYDVLLKPSRFVKELDSATYEEWEIDDKRMLDIPESFEYNKTTIPEG